MKQATPETPQNTLRHYPLGDSINGSPHSVCVSLPTMAAVIGYEEKDPEICRHIASGYPRFVVHPFLQRIAARVAAANDLRRQSIFLCCGENEALQAIAFAGTNAHYTHFEGLFLVHCPTEDNETNLKLRHFLQHTGTALGSREAQQWLLAAGHPLEVHSEQRSSESDPSLAIRTQLAGLYHAADPADIHLSRGGMNGFYAAFKAVDRIQQRKGRTIWIQLGWLYVDTMRILEKMGSVQPITLFNVLDLDALHDLLRHCGHQVAGIVTEIPTNPLIQTTDLPRLRALADNYGCALLLDPTIASPHNVHILPYADAHINSLTKYAGNRGDVLCGAVALNRDSHFYQELQESLQAWLSQPSELDLARLAFQMNDYAHTVDTANRNTEAVAEFLSGQSRIADLWWAQSPDVAANFTKIRQTGGGPGAMLSFRVHGDWQAFYDKLRMAKTPSFGMYFSVLCPFMYLAHYDQVTTPEGRAALATCGLAPDLLRLSVGTEKADDICAVLQEALS